jgi:tetratricopeptide (TPR) repeat protein
MKIINKYFFSYFLTAVFVLLFFFCDTNTVFAKGKDKKSKSPNANNPQISVAERLERESAFIDAIQAKAIDNIEEAIMLFKEILRKDPKNDAAAYELCRIFYELGDLETAVLYGEKAIKINKNNEWYYIYVAEAKAQTGDYVGGAKMYEQLLLTQPKNYDYYYDWAYLLSEGGKSKEAIAVLDKLENIQGPLPDIIMEKVALYNAIPKLDGAIGEVLKLVKEYPEDINYIGILGELYEDNKQLDKAAGSYNSILNIDPHNTQAMMSLAQVYKKQNNTVKYNAIIDSLFSNPKSDIDDKIQTTIPLLESASRSEDTILADEALKIATLIYKAHPNDVKATALMADAYNIKGDTKTAQQWYEKATQMANVPANVWIQLYIICIDQQDTLALVRTSAMGIEKNPEDVFGYFYNALGNFQLKNHQKTIDILEIGLTKNIPTAALKSQMYTTLADACYELKYYEKMDSAYELALEIDPNNPYSLNNYAYYLSERDQSLKKAELMSKRSLILEPKNASFIDTYAWIKYKLGNYKEALELLNKALTFEEGRSNAVVYEHLGDVYIKIGDKVKAIDAWQKAMDAGGDKTIIQQKIDSLSTK